MHKTYVIGDIHGYYEKLVANLVSAGLMDDDLYWTGGECALWFLGDFFDRGPRGIDVLNLVMHLQAEAADDGGRVSALIGNHEVQLLGAYHFRHQKSTGPGRTFLADWQRNGGIGNDLARLNVQHVAWLSNLPAMARVGERLLMHADSQVYTHYGDSVEAVNAAIYDLLHSDDTEAWDRILSQFSAHKTFATHREEGIKRALHYLDTYGGRQIVHGHSPINTVTYKPASSITEPLVYADGLCINVDGGLYSGGPGFVYELPPVHELVPVI